LRQLRGPKPLQRSGQAARLAENLVTDLQRSHDGAHRVPIYFVLGNHDFYHGSIAAVRQAVARQSAASRWLHWLPISGVVPLTATTALVGHDSWADGRLGDFLGSEVLLNDYVLIAELRARQIGTLRQTEQPRR
jgi:hypothetical protein